MKSIKVSVIIPVYNVEKYLEQCLDSVVNQTLKEIEIIIINDGSTDNSRNILKKYKLDERIIIIDTENEGVASARNKGLFYSNGEYVCFVDSDDYIEEDMLQQLYCIAQKEKSDIVQSGINCFYENPKRNFQILYKQNTICNTYSAIDAVKLYLKHDIRGYAPTKIIKRNLLIKNEIIFPPNVNYEDMVPTLKTLFYANQITLYNRPLYYYRQRENSRSRGVNDKNIYDYIQQVQECLLFLEQNNIDSILDDEIICFRIMNYLNAINWFIKLKRCDKKQIKVSYSEYFSSFDINYPLSKVLRVKELNRNYKIIYVLQKLNVYRLFIKWGLF